MACRSCRPSCRSSRPAGPSRSTATRRSGTTRSGPGSDGCTHLRALQRYAPQEGGALRRRVEDQAVVVGAEHQARAQTDVAARQRLVVDAAHAEHLVVAAACGADRLVGLPYTVVAKLARNAHLQRQV